jgi:hypothetical protein
MVRRFKFKRPAKPERDREVFQLLRLMRGHKTADLARSSGVSASCISKLRTRRTRWPRFYTVRAIAKACGWEYALIPAEAFEAERPREEQRPSLH